MSNMILFLLNALENDNIDHFNIISNITSLYFCQPRKMTVENQHLLPSVHVVLVNITNKAISCDCFLFIYILFFGGCIPSKGNKVISTCGKNFNSNPWSACTNIYKSEHIHSLYVHFAARS